MRALPDRDRGCPQSQQKGTDRPPSGARVIPAAPLVAHSGIPVLELRSYDHAQSIDGPIGFRKAGETKPNFCSGSQID